MFHNLREDSSLIFRLLRLARPFWPHLSAILLLSLIGTPLALLSPIPLKLVVDSVIGFEPIPTMIAVISPEFSNDSGSSILVLAIVLLLAIALVNQAVYGLSSYLYSYTTERIGLRFRSDLLEHAQRLSLAYHDARGTSDSVYRIQWDSNAVQYVVVDTIIPLTAAGFAFIGMMYVTVRIDFQLALIAMGVSPIFVLVAALRRTKLRPLGREAKSVESSAMSILQEAIGTLRVVKAFGQERRERQRFVERSKEGVAKRLSHTRLELYFDLAVGSATAVGTAAVIYIGTQHVQSGTLTLGELLLVMAYLGSLYQPLQEIGKKTANAQGALASAERAFELLDEEPDVPELKHPRPLKKATGSVEFRDVSFAYEADRLVLKNITFHIVPGARVGISGRTGSGKSTMMQLLMRLYDPTSGTILLDGRDIRNYRVIDLRRQFGFVLQEPVLFSTSIAENISYGRPEATFDEIVRSAELAGAHEFISALPDGYHAVVGERGMQLFGGERQRVSLARAFLRDAPILILDEPTSSVDLQTEKSIIDAMERLIRGRTTFMIAHRISTLDNCDIRINLAEGRLQNRQTNLSRNGLEQVSHDDGRS